MRLPNSKRGVTLVELIAVCAISVVVIAAACTLLYAASKSAARGAAEAAGHGDAHLLETYLQDDLPSALSVGTQHPDSGDVTSLHFGEDGALILEKDGGAGQYIDGIESLALSLSKAGGNRKLSYTIRAGDSGGSYSLTGGVVLNNVSQAQDGGPWTLSPGSDVTFYIRKESSE